MKSLCTLTALALLVAVPLSLMAAEDGAAVYKSKCAACHGDNGEGKSAIKMPPVKGTTMTVEQLVPYLTKGEPGKTIHGKPISGLSEEQAKAVSEFIKEMK